MGALYDEWIKENPRFKKIPKRILIEKLHTRETNKGKISQWQEEIELLNKEESQQENLKIFLNRTEKQTEELFPGTVTAPKFTKDFFNASSAQRIKNSAEQLRKEGFLGQARSFLGGAAEFTSFGIPEQILGTARWLKSKVNPLMERQPERKEFISEAREEFKAAEIAFPKTFISGEVVGGITQAIVPGVIAAEITTKIAPTIAKIVPKIPSIIKKVPALVEKVIEKSAQLLKTQQPRIFNILKKNAPIAIESFAREFLDVKIDSKTGEVIERSISEKISDASKVAGLGVGISKLFGIPSAIVKRFPRLAKGFEEKSSIALAKKVFAEDLLKGRFASSAEKLTKITTGALKGKTKLPEVALKKIGDEFKRIKLFRGLPFLGRGKVKSIFIKENREIINKEINKEAVKVGKDIGKFYTKLDIQNIESVSLPKLLTGIINKFKNKFNFEIVKGKIKAIAKKRTFRGKIQNQFNDALETIQEVKPKKVDKFTWKQIQNIKKDIGELTWASSGKERKGADFSKQVYFNIKEKMADAIKKTGKKDIKQFDKLNERFEIYTFLPSFLKSKFQMIAGRAPAITKGQVVTLRGRVFERIDKRFVKNIQRTANNILAFTAKRGAELAAGRPTRPLTEQLKKNKFLKQLAEQVKGVNKERIGTQITLHKKLIQENPFFEKIAEIVSKGKIITTDFLNKFIKKEKE